MKPDRDLDDVSAVVHELTSHSWEQWDNGHRRRCPRCEKGQVIGPAYAAAADYLNRTPSRQRTGVDLTERINTAINKSCREIHRTVSSEPSDETSNAAPLDHQLPPLTLPGQLMAFITKATDHTEVLVVTLRLRTEKQVEIAKLCNISTSRVSRMLDRLRERLPSEYPLLAAAIRMAIISALAPSSDKRTAWSYPVPEEHVEILSREVATLKSSGGTALVGAAASNRTLATWGAAAFAAAVAVATTFWILRTSGTEVDDVNGSGITKPTTTTAHSSGLPALRPATRPAEGDDNSSPKTGIESPGTTTVAAPPEAAPIPIRDFLSRMLSPNVLPILGLIREHNAALRGESATSSGSRWRDVTDALDREMHGGNPGRANTNAAPDETLRRDGRLCLTSTDSLPNNCLRALFDPDYFLPFASRHFLVPDTDSPTGIDPGSLYLVPGESVVLGVSGPFHSDGANTHRPPTISVAIARGNRATWVHVNSAGDEYRDDDYFRIPTFALSVRFDDQRIHRGLTELPDGSVVVEDTPAHQLDALVNRSLVKFSRGKSSRVAVEAEDIALEVEPFVTTYYVGHVDRQRTLGRYYQFLANAPLRIQKEGEWTLELVN